MLIQLASFFIGLMQCFHKSDAGEGIRLENAWYEKCLTHDTTQNLILGRDCNLADDFQEWRWIENLLLQNVGSGKCLQASSTGTTFEMQECAFSTNSQRYTCMFNLIKTFRVTYLALDGSFQLVGSGISEKVRWRVFPASNDNSICNTTENRVWRKTAQNVMDVSGGINPLIIFAKTNLPPHNMFMMDRLGKVQNLTGYLKVLSVAPHAVWGINAFTLYFAGQEGFSFGQQNVPWTSVSSLSVKYLDFSVPKKGYVFTVDGRWCSRQGITDNDPKGTQFSCSTMSETLDHMSCGVTGCFAIIAGIIHYKRNQAWVEVGNPNHETFAKVEAGPIYEIWAITVDGRSYKRLGMSDDAPMGTAWERIGNVMLRDVSLSVCGPVGIHFYSEEIMMLNGSPTPQRQRELDRWCTNHVPECTYRTVGSGCQSSDKCYARYSPSQADHNNQWRCFRDDGLRVDGNVWKSPDAGCLYTRVTDLEKIAYRYPIFGDFELQRWLDLRCQNPDFNSNVNGCDNPYFADFVFGLEKMVCRTTHTTSTCPLRSDFNDLLELTRASCADIPLLKFLPNSSFSYSSDTRTNYAAMVKMNVPNQAWCLKWHSSAREIFMEIDFRFLHKMCAVGTKGADEWQVIGNYYVSYSKDGETFTYSSVFGSRYAFRSKRAFEKHYLPAPVEGRYFRITYRALKSTIKCLKLELYGSSKEFEASSCQDYKDILFATLDGFYNIYPTGKETKQRVFCKGLSEAGPAESLPYGLLGTGAEHIGCFLDNFDRAIPTHIRMLPEHDVAHCHAIASAAGYEVFALQQPGNCFSGPQAHTTYNKHGPSSYCVNGKGGTWSNSVYRIKKVDKKIFWALNTTKDGLPGTLIHGQRAVKVEQGSNARAIADFSTHCFSDPQLCKEGFSIELWLWFKSPLDRFPQTTTILQSGRSSISRSISLYIRHDHVCMDVLFFDVYWRACVGSMGDPDNWLHVVSSWNEEDGLELIVDDLRFRSHGGKADSSYERQDLESVLQLGDHRTSQSKKYEIAVHSLTIWERTLTVDEVEIFFTKGYTLAAEGKSCKATCEEKGLTCVPSMTANLLNILERLGEVCPTVKLYDAEDTSQPYVSSTGVCHGVSNLEKISCDASKDDVRRLCRCEKPVHGGFTEWTQWSFCSRTCGYGRRIRTRSCTYPAPRLGGNNCEGTTHMVEDCQELPCGVTSGVLREIWLGNQDVILKQAYTISNIKGYPYYPTYSHIIENFTTPSTSRVYYGERLQSFFRPPLSGNYRFLMNCSYSCKLIFTQHKEPRKMLLNLEYGTNVARPDKIQLTQKVMELSKWANKFDLDFGSGNIEKRRDIKPFTEKTDALTLVAGELYSLEVEMVVQYSDLEFSLGFEHVDSGLIQDPISKEHLTWKQKIIRGITREVWNTRSYNLESQGDIERFISKFPTPDFEELNEEFEVPEFGRFYAQRLQAYFLAPLEGSYNFYLACSGGCSFYLNLTHHISTSNVNPDSKYTSGQSFSLSLKGGSFNHLKVLHHVATTANYVVLGVTLPDNTQLRPIPSEYLWIQIPEKLRSGLTTLQKATKGNYVASNAMDNDFSTWSRTPNKDDPWFRLYSKDEIYVFAVGVTSTATSTWLQNFYVKVGNHDPKKTRNANVRCYGPVSNIQARKTVAFPCAVPLRGKYIVVYRFGKSIILSIAEIIVYGERIKVYQKRHGLGLTDGRIEKEKMFASSLMANNDEQFARLHHLSEAWCPLVEDSTPYFVVNLWESKFIAGIAMQGHPLEQKYVLKAKVDVLVDGTWEVTVDRHNRQTYSFYHTATYIIFKTTYRGSSVKIRPQSWHVEPCLRLEIVGLQWPGNFVWNTKSLRNSTTVEYSKGQRYEDGLSKNAVYIPRSSTVKLHGFNVPCLTNPQACLGNFTFKLVFSFTDESANGVIFSTTGYNTSVIGTSLFLKNSKLTASVRTKSRNWTVSGPADMTANVVQSVEINWRYDAELTLKMDSATYQAELSMVPHTPTSGVDLKGILNVGDIDMYLHSFSFEALPYDNEWARKIQNGVDGWHTEWEPWGYCSTSCGSTGVQNRYRRCWNPSPKFNGKECPKQSLIETRPCLKPSCESDEGVLREVWMNKRPPEFTLANVFDGYASHLEVVESFVLSYNDGPFAEKLRTFLRANESGLYEFELFCTYQCELWISPNDEADDKVKIISHDGSGNADWPISTISESYTFESDENYYIEVRSFEIKGARTHTLMTIKAPSAAAPGTGFSLVRHKPDCYHGLGVESGAVPDSNIYSLKFWGDDQFAYTGRLNGPYPHCNKKNLDPRFYIHFDELHWIVAVAVQGFDKDGVSGYVTEFEIATTLDYLSDTITKHDRNFKIYPGNDNANSIKVINLSEPVRSKNVIVHIKAYSGKGCLRLDVIGCHAGNLAYKKVASNYKAVDGSFDRTNWQYCSRSAPVDNYVWWLVDFGATYYVGEVFIVARKDCCLHRMHSLQIRVGNSSSNGGSLNPQCRETFSMTDVTARSVYCDPYGHGQYLSISKYDDEDFMLCEVSVFQIENDTVFSEWTECSVTCGFGFQQRHTVCAKPYYCKRSEEIRPCFAGKYCKIMMQNCGQLHALGETETGVHKVRPNPEVENDIFVYCDHDTERGGWLVLQRRSANGDLNMTQSWDMYTDGFGNVSTEFWIGNKYLSQLTNHTAYEIMFLFKRANGSVLKKTKCDAFNVSSEEENYRLELGTCEGPDAEILKFSNWTEFSTWDKDNGVSSLNCTSEITGWWFGSCNSYINDKTMSCVGLASCDYDVTMMIKPNKIDGGWSHWTSWETCDKPCGGGNSSRVRACTHPPPTGGGDDCEGHWNETVGCNTRPCPEIEVNVTMKFTEETWSTFLVNPSSPPFQDLALKISNNIKTLYNNDPAVNVAVHSFRQGSVIADVSILYDSLDDQQLIVLQEDLDQDGLLNQDMPVVYEHTEIVTSEVLFGPPHITQLGNTSSTIIYISWQPPNTTDLNKILGYRIFYKKSNQTSLTMLVQSVEKNVLEFEITDLDFYKNYSVRVCAFSSAGNGVPTTAHHVMTDEDVPAAAPFVTSAQNLSSTALNVSWVALDSLLFHGVPTGYVLHYRIKTSDNTTAFLNITIDDFLVENINITDLMKYTVYEVYMTATTVKGEGKRGESVYLRTDEDIPSQPPVNMTLQNRTSTSLNISWSAIPQAFVHGVLRAYVIEYWPLADQNDTANTTAEPWKTEKELIELKKFTNYSIRISGMTSKGLGNWSEIITLQTDEDIPDHGPMDLTGFNISATSINVSWGLIPEEYRNGIIIGYRLYYNDDIHHSGSLTLPASQRHVILENLLSYSLYNISVAGITSKGEGWNRTFVFIYSAAGAPSREPWELLCPDVSSYTASLHWYRFTPDLTGSILTGYFISYSAIEPPHPAVYNVTLESFKHNYVVEHLKAFTNYSFELYVFNPWGRSNASTVVCKTEEGKPLASPSNFVVVSNVAPDKIILKWDTVPDLLMAGIRRGYTIKYKKTKEVGESVEGVERRIDIFDPQQTEIVVDELEFFCQYSFTIRVFNTKFYGDDSEIAFGETCNCMSDFYSNWCTYLPYVNTSDTGIFPPLIRNAISGVCGNCSEYGEAKIHFDTYIDGSSLKTSSLVKVKRGIDEERQINFPLIGRKDANSFVPIIDTPGSVFITKKPSLTMAVEYMFFDTVIGTLPLLGFAIITASLAGVVMWCLERNKNTELFPKRFSRGAPEGFWLAFISMTTVGYGDRVAITIPGRIFSIIWTLYGLVITGMLVGNLTSALTASVAFTVNEVDLYQAKIAAIENSSEFKLGLAKGAFVNKGRNFSDILTVLHAVEVGSVEGALLDMYVVASRPDLMTKDSPLMVKTVIQNPSTYGIELSGHAKKLRKPFLQYLHNNAALVSKILEEYTNPVKESEGEIESPDDMGENDINVLAPGSPVIEKPFLFSCIALGVALIVGLVSHFTLCKRRRKAIMKDSGAVEPVTTSAELKTMLNNQVSEFCKKSKITISKIKLRHKQELKKYLKFH